MPANFDCNTEVSNEGTSTKQIRRPSAQACAFEIDCERTRHVTSTFSASNRVTSAEPRKPVEPVTRADCKVLLMTLRPACRHESGARSSRVGKAKSPRRMRGTNLRSTPGPVRDGAVGASRGIAKIRSEEHT